MIQRTLIHSQPLSPDLSGGFFRPPLRRDAGDDGRYVQLLYQLDELGYVLVHHILQNFCLLVDSDRNIFKDLVGLLRRCEIRAGDHWDQLGQLAVKLHREVEPVPGPLVVHLDQLVFDGRQLFLQRAGLARYSFGRGVAGGPFLPLCNLPPDTAKTVYGVVGLR